LFQFGQTVLKASYSKKETEGIASAISVGNVHYSNERKREKIICIKVWTLAIALLI